MGRNRNGLSARFVDTVTKPGRYADGGNLYLSISSNGGRRWVFLFRWNGKIREMGLGSARDVSLAKARIKAKAARELLLDGKDPIGVRQNERMTPTFGEAADAHIEAMEPSWRNDKHAAQWKMTLTRYAGPIRDKRVDDVTTEDVLSVLQVIWQTKPETASRVRGRIEAVLDAAKAKGHRQGENPARWRGHLDKLLPPRRKLSRGHHAAMPFSEVPDVVAKLRETRSTSNLALEFAILTAARSGEVMGAVWPEVDLRKKLWTVPGARMKGGREHHVPLTDRAVEIIENMKVARNREHGDYIFSGQKAGRPLSVMALTMALRRIGAGEFTVHGFRSSFRDWCGDCTNHPREVAEAALAHTIRDATEAAYRRASALEKRRVLMRDWAEYLGRAGGENVIDLNSAKGKP